MAAEQLEGGGVRMMAGAGALVAPATPGTPGTPGAPLFSGPRVDSQSYERKSLPHYSGHCCLQLDYGRGGGGWGAPASHAPGCFACDSVSLPKLPDVSLTRKLGAEFVGSFVLMFCATAGPIVNQKYSGAESLIGNAACAGLGVMIVILSTGHISGAHLNPSLTLAFAAFRHFPWIHVPAYIICQVAATIAANFALKAVFHPALAGGVTIPAPNVSASQAFFIELIITFNLLFVVTAVATDTRAVGELAGIAVGATVLLNILVAGPSTGGSMNPIRTLGPAVATGNYTQIWIYIVAPTIGALLGAGVYTLVKLRDENGETPRPTRSFRR